jgi:RNA polymerase sigma factor (sigma-70 family)
MTDRVLVEALRARDPGALAALYDSHAGGIYRYCWSLLLNSDSAQVALRDTLIAAEAHVQSLADPDRLRPWLYALARGECLRRRTAAPPGRHEAPAEAPVPDKAGDAGPRLMAWNAVHGLPVADREILELSAGHDFSVPELAAVLGVSPRQVETAMAGARERLRDAITAEALAGNGPYDCSRVARILTGFSGELTPDMREHLVKHLARCETCSPHRNRQVSAAKVFELLPLVTPPKALRVRVLSCFIDPELMPYRRYVGRRSGALDAAGFPVERSKRARRWPQALAGTLAAVATVVAIVLIFQEFGRDNGGPSGVATAAFPPGVRLPWNPGADDMPVDVQPILDSTDNSPLGTIGSALPPPVGTQVATQGVVHSQATPPPIVQPRPTPTTPSRPTPGGPAITYQPPPTPVGGQRPHGDHTWRPRPGGPHRPGGRPDHPHGPPPTWRPRPTWSHLPTPPPTVSQPPTAQPTPTPSVPVSGPTATP